MIGASARVKSTPQTVTPARSRLNEQLYAQERDLQLQRFRAEQQMLLQTMRDAPLQRLPRPASWMLSNIISGG